jgi:hypothetical protein
VQAVQIAGTARLPSNLRKDSDQIITKPMLRIRSGQPGKPERALQRTGGKLVAVLAPGSISPGFANLRIRGFVRNLSESSEWRIAKSNGRHPQPQRTRGHAPGVNKTTMTIAKVPRGKLNPVSACQHDKSLKR